MSIRQVLSHAVPDALGRAPHAYRKTTGRHKATKWISGHEPLRYAYRYVTVSEGSLREE